MTHLLHACRWTERLGPNARSPRQTVQRGGHWWWSVSECPCHQWWTDPCKSEKELRWISRSAQSACWMASLLQKPPTPPHFVITDRGHNEGLLGQLKYLLNNLQSISKLSLISEGSKSHAPPFNLKNLWHGVKRKKKKISPKPTCKQCPHLPSGHHSL